MRTALSQWNGEGGPQSQVILTLGVHRCPQEPRRHRRTSTIGILALRRSPTRYSGVATNSLARGPARLMSSRHVLDEPANRRTHPLPHSKTLTLLPLLPLHVLGQDSPFSPFGHLYPSCSESVGVVFGGTKESEGCTSLSIIIPWCS